MNDLTRREMQVLEHLFTGKSNQHIAEHLNLSVHTIKYHLRNVYKKLKVTNRAMLICNYYKNHSSKKI